MRSTYTLADTIVQTRQLRNGKTLILKETPICVKHVCTSCHDPSCDLPINDCINIEWGILKAKVFHQHKGAFNVMSKADFFTPFKGALYSQFESEKGEKGVTQVVTSVSNVPNTHKENYITYGTFLICILIVVLCACLYIRAFSS